MLKQPGSKMCFVCGRENPIGLHAEFFVKDDKVLVEFVPQQNHQGYPGIMHGGLVTALLDETIGRSAFLNNMWVVTAKLELRFRKPVPIGQKITVLGWVTRVRGSLLEAQGEVRLEDGSVAVEANGLYIRLPEGKRQEIEALVF